ncbi:hypothetical protein STANM309S_04347 [Streptomyces tanashiensis]
MWSSTPLPAPGVPPYERLVPQPGAPAEGLFRGRHRLAGGRLGPLRVEPCLPGLPQSGLQATDFRGCFLRLRRRGLSQPLPLFELLLAPGDLGVGLRGRRACTLEIPAPRGFAVRFIRGLELVLRLRLRLRFRPLPGRSLGQRCLLRGDRGEADGGLRHLREPTPRPQLGDVLVGENTVQGLLDLVHQRLAHRLPRLPGQLGGRTSECGDEPVLLPARRPQLLGVERPVRLTQPLPQREEALCLLPSFPGEPVRRPRGERGLPQRGDLLRRHPVLRPACLGDVRVACRDELARLQPVQLLGDLLDIHTAYSRRSRGPRPSCP